MVKGPEVSQELCTPSGSLGATLSSSQRPITPTAQVMPDTPFWLCCPWKRGPETSGPPESDAGLSSPFRL